MAIKTNIINEFSINSKLMAILSLPLITGEPLSSKLAKEKVWLG